MHSVRNEPTKLILVGTRITHQAIGDAGNFYLFYCFLRCYTTDCSTVTYLTIGAYVYLKGCHDERGKGTK